MKTEVMMPMGARWAMLIVGSLLLCFCHAEAQAIPRYSAQYGQKCLLCHNNPTGGGMRSSYASQYIVPMELAADDLGKEPGEGFDPYLNESITVGADLRTLAVNVREENHKSESNMFQMQGDVYLNAQLDERFSAYVDRGMSGSYEVYAMGFILPAGGYVKVGRFATDYGWRFADHKAYVRDLLDLDPPTHSDVGVEVGFFPGTNTISLALLNGSSGALMDNDDLPAISARAEHRHGVGPLKAALGGSYRRDRESDGARRIAGPFAYLSWGPLTWLGEWDWDRDFSPSAGAERTALVTSHELSWQLRQGFALRGTANFYDPDIDSASGARSRFGIGFDTMPYPFLDLVGMVNFHRFDVGPAVAGLDYAQVELMLHVFY